MTAVINYLVIIGYRPNIANVVPVLFFYKLYSVGLSGIGAGACVGMPRGLAANKPVAGVNVNMLVLAAGIGISILFMCMQHV